LGRRRHGFVVFSKRLEQGRFDVLRGDGPSRELKRDELMMLLEGVRLSSMTRKARYCRAQ